MLRTLKERILRWIGAIDEAAIPKYSNEDEPQGAQKAPFRAGSVYFDLVMSEADLYKLFSSYDGEADLSDFTPAELEKLLREGKQQNFKEKYFDYYDDVKSPSLKKQDW